MCNPSWYSQARISLWGKWQKFVAFVPETTQCFHFDSTESQTWQKYEQSIQLSEQSWMSSTPTSSVVHQSASEAIIELYTCRWSQSGINFLCGPRKLEKSWNYLCSLWAQRLSFLMNQVNKMHLCNEIDCGLNRVPLFIHMSFHFLTVAGWLFEWWSFCAIGSSL